MDIKGINYYTEENCTPRGNYAVSSGNFLPMFLGQPNGPTLRVQVSKRKLAAPILSLYRKECKGKGHPITGHQGPRRGVEV
jgi:hypothetical protein